MKKKILSFIIVFCMLISMILVLNNSTIAAADEGVSAIFGGGPLYQGGQSVMNDLRASGFNTVIIWSIHVHSNGDLYINDTKICSGGSYVGDAIWKTQWATLKQAPTSITRVEVSVGAWGCADFESIRDLINSQGTGSNTVLYRNFAALKEATGADAVDYDDESCYDVASSVSFGQMCAAMGYKVTLCPYSNNSYWSSVKTQLGTSIVDRVYLQCYAGGSGNSPSTWSSYMGMKVIPGLWCLNSSSGGDSASTVQSKLTNWKSSSVGGFMWLYDDMMKLSSPNSTADYANAINTVFGGGTTPTPTPILTPTPTPIPTPSGTNVALNKAATANQYVSGETPAKAVDGSVTNNSKWCSNASGDKWLMLDLGQNYDIDRWVVKHAGAGGETSSWNTKNFKLQKSSNGTSWVDVDTVTNNTSNITDRTVTAFNTQYARLYITTPTQNSDIATRIYELELYSSGGLTPTLTPTPTPIPTPTPTGSPTYPSISGDTRYEWIGEVRIGTLNNTSGSNNGYGDYSSITTNMAKGTVQNVSLIPGFSGSSYSEYWKVWVDLNKDGDFTDSGEELFSGNGAGTVTGTLTIPSSAATGSTRMRVVMKYSSAPPSSGTMNYGEAEDYTVNIQ